MSLGNVVQGQLQKEVGATHRVSFAERPDVEEGKCLLRLEDLHRRDLAWKLLGRHAAATLIGSYP